MVLNCCDFLMGYSTRSPHLDIAALKNCFCPSNDGSIRRQLHDGGSNIIEGRIQCLKLRQRHVALLHLPIRGVVLIVGEQRVALPRWVGNGRVRWALRVPNLAPEEHHFVVFKRAALSRDIERPLHHIQALRDIPVHVVRVVIVVPPEIAFHSFNPVHKKVKRRVVPTRTVVIINRFLDIVIINEKIAMNGSIRHVRRRVPMRVGRDVGLAIPGVERAMVPALSARGENEVAFNDIATSETVIEVDSRAWAVKKDVPGEVRTRSFRLHEKGGLLLIQTDFSRHASFDGSVERVLAVRAINPSLRGVQ